MEKSKECKNCGSKNIITMNEEVAKNSGCLIKLIMFGLLFVPIIGWGIVLYLWFGPIRTKTVISHVCQDCGHKEIIS